MLRKILAGAIVLGVLMLGTLYWLGTRDDALVQSTAIAATDAGRSQSVITQTSGPFAVEKPAAAILSTNEQLIQRGSYLARAADCAGCHTAQGGQPFAGGTPISTPFGTLYGPNITFDRQYGIGTWSADDFWRALHNGKGRDGELLYPAFPYTDFTHVSRQDSDALYAYLRTVPAISAPNREHELDFPYSLRVMMSIWRAFFFRPGTVEVDPARSLLWNRGRYLVEGLAHCAACHAPRGFLGSSDLAQGMSGGLIPAQNWYAPALANDAIAGLGAWSTQDVATLLKTGISTRSSAIGPMAEVIHNSTQYLTDEDAIAIGSYLKTLPASHLVAPSQKGEADQAVMIQGAKIYKDNCAQCHKASGVGAPPAWPPLLGNLTVLAPIPVNAIRVVLDGGFAPSTAGNPNPHSMPPFGQRLDDNDVAAVVTYIRNMWGNSASGVTSLEVKVARRSSMME